MSRISCQDLETKRKESECQDWREAEYFIVIRWWEDVGRGVMGYCSFRMPLRILVSLGRDVLLAGDKVREI